MYQVFRRIRQILNIPVAAMSTRHIHLRRPEDSRIQALTVPTLDPLRIRGKATTARIRRIRRLRNRYRIFDYLNLHVTHKTNRFTVNRIKHVCLTLLSVADGAAEFRRIRHDHRGAHKGVLALRGGGQTAAPAQGAVFAAAGRTGDTPANAARVDERLVASDGSVRETQEGEARAREEREHSAGQGSGAGEGDRQVVGQSVDRRR